MNVIVVVIDTLRYDYVGANGNLDIRTPNLDRLAAKSWSFDRAFAASFPTIPHRKDVITGRYGAPFHPWAPLACDVPTLPGALHEAGYCTQLIHDTPHLVNGGHSFDFPFHCWTPVRGAEVDRAWLTDDWALLGNWAFDPMFDLMPRDMGAMREGWPGLTGYVQSNRRRTRDEDWNVARLFRTASDFLRDNSKRDNFFLWLDCFDPHEPWDAPPEYVLMYDETPGYDGRIDPRGFLPRTRNNAELSEAAADRIKAWYAAKVSFMDHWLGVFLHTLDETGLDKRTAVVLTADHGTNVGDRDGRRFGKTGPPRENESHVPFMVCVPGEAGGRCDAIVQPQDVFATVAALPPGRGVAGCAVPDGVESYDVLKVARDGGAGPRGIALAGGAVRAGPWGRPEAVLFSAFDREWRLGVAADPARSVLERLGGGENVTAERPEVVERIQAAAIGEIARRGLDPGWVEWLRGQGRGTPPAEFSATDARPAPEGWRVYWKLHYSGE